MSRDKAMFLVVIAWGALGAVLSRVGLSDPLLYVVGLLGVLVVMTVYFAYEIGDQVRARLRR